jgi:MYXO-CTERM domain-containing protein
MMVCIAPNSDLLGGVCNGGGEGSGAGFGSLTTTPSSSSGDGGPAAAVAGSPAGSGSSSGQGGCQVGSDATGGSWSLVVMTGVLAMARWRPRRRRRGR